MKDKVFCKDINNFEHRKLLNPISPKQTVHEIGINEHFQGISYSLRNSEIIGGFLEDKVHSISNDHNFQQIKCKIYDKKIMFMSMVIL